MMILRMGVEIYFVGVVVVLIEYGRLFLFKYRMLVFWYLLVVIVNVGECFKLLLVYVCVLL